MHNPSSTVPGALPRRYDVFLGVSAIVSYVGIVAFAVTQVSAGLRIEADQRFAIVMWLLTIGGADALCWMLRPHIAHIAYAMEIGRHLENSREYGTLDADYPRQLAARRYFWGACGTIAACSWTLALAIDVAVRVGMLNLHGSNLAMVTTVFCGVGGVTCVVRIVGPALAELDDVYRLACDHASRENVLQFPRSNGA